MLSPTAVQRYYDRSGTFQDRQGFYEDPALDDLVAHAGFAEARAIVEFGCGTGRFAQRILGQVPAAAYDGFDVSGTMVNLASQRLAAFGDRARVHRVAPGTVRLPLGDQCSDRFIGTYVLDLLAPQDIATVVQEARRVLRPGGRLCLVGLTNGARGFPRLVAWLWSQVFRWRPQLVGGCRPIELTEHLSEEWWDVVYHGTVVSWAISSEVIVACPRARPPGPGGHGVAAGGTSSSESP